MELIDLRSDTVTRPDAPMIAAMANAAVGDDVYGEDPTVNELQDTVAGLLGKEAALFVPTGVMSNQLCLKVLTSPGDEVIIGENCHIYNYETGAPALLSGVQIHPIPDTHGCMELDAVEEAIREDAYYLPRTALVALEQTHNREGGAVIPIDRIAAISRLAGERGIARHLDGARLWNACVATGITPGTYAAHFDTVSVCLSKGLGAPAGSVMAGTRRHVEIARHFRKIWGGGWRQAGILAAAGLHALRNNVERLREDHENARLFADALHDTPNLQVLHTPQTNIVLFAIRGTGAPEFEAHVAQFGVKISAAFKGKLRAVFHKDVTQQSAMRAAECVRAAAEGLSSSGENA
ncbi:MAG: aminotransferase class I/II-fold pyridoxal phosphate-dependent enzyme [Bacteroidetes bacterium]|nr:aminotransferase class I/II-fold pyridoxal phosphate-dependent enzyme [Bacteroidota bacterium]